MAVGIISDSHQYLDALVATLDGPLAGCERLVCLGDFMDRGPDDPAELLDVLVDRRVEILCGNHELAYLGGPAVPGMKKRGRRLTERLRDMVIDGHLRAATVAEGCLLIHGGISRKFWRRYLRDEFGEDIQAIARHINRRFVLATARNDFSNPIFNARTETVRGPLWARLKDDLPPKRRLPPFTQVVGHTPVPEVRWYDDPDGGRGRLCATDVAGGEPVDGLLGHMVLEPARVT